jgi:hypothetical protein
VNTTTTTTTDLASKEIAAQERSFARMMIQQLENQIETAQYRWEDADEAGDTAAMLIWESRLMDLEDRIEDANPNRVC